MTAIPCCNDNDMDSRIQTCEDIEFDFSAFNESDELNTELHVLGSAIFYSYLLQTEKKQ